MIKETEPNKTSLVYNAFEIVNYRDAFQIELPNNTFENIDDFVNKYFLSQPRWLILVSFGLFSRKTIEKSLKESNLQINTNIGNWKIFNRNENEIVFGDSMGFMDYRFSMRLDKNTTDDIEVSTVVTFNWRLGKYYFALIKLMHKKFVLLSLNVVFKT